MPEDESHGWYSRGYLPHCDGPGLLQSITFRLHDAVPKHLIEEWKGELLDTPASAEGRTSLPATDSRIVQLRKRIERYEDAGCGACWLRDERIAAVVQKALLHFDGQRYRLLAWCVMPNHVHTLIESWVGWPLEGMVHSWKSFTAQQANGILGRKGPFWFREYRDRFIPDHEHLQRTF